MYFFMGDMYFEKKEPDGKIWWGDSENDGEYLFTFDKKNVFNLFEDYPYKLTPEQKKLFDEENPFWAEFFEDR